MKTVAAFEPASDPFREESAHSLHTQARVLGGIFEFQSNDVRLLRLADVAFKGLPAHVFHDKPRFRVHLLLSPEKRPRIAAEPPRMKLHSGGGFLCGTMDAVNFAIVSPAERRALVVASRDMLEYPYHLRYELIEFAAYLLASRAQQLVSLHAACVGRKGRGVLLMGESGAGKSTLTLHCLLQGMELIAEDGVLVAPDTMLATGTGSFLHLRADSLRFLRGVADDAWIRNSPVIRRRSGAEKFEVDLRHSPCRIAMKPAHIVGAVFLSKSSASRTQKNQSLLVPLGKAEFLERLREAQPYAAGQPNWAAFSKRAAGIGAFELRRGQHPGEAVNALSKILEGVKSPGLRADLGD